MASIYSKNLGSYLLAASLLLDSPEDLIASKILQESKCELEENVYHDNWDGGIDYHTLKLYVSLTLFKEVKDRLNEVEEKICQVINLVARDVEHEGINRVTIAPVIFKTQGKPPLEGVTKSGLNSTQLFCPTIFQIPEESEDEKLVALMIPFSMEFNSVSTRIKEAAEELGLICKRADDMWNSSTIIQDVFSLIYRARFVICDFSGKNANVFYEAGIAHTLGRLVIPITQNIDDVPFDLRHHRHIHYLANEQGLQKLKDDLQKKYFKN